MKGVDVAPFWVFEGAGAVPMEGVVTAEDGSREEVEFSFDSDLPARRS